MSTLNKLPDGSPSPYYECTAIDTDDIEHTETLQEWWCDGKKVMSIEESAEDYFYGYFDKCWFELTRVRKVEA